MSALTHAGKPHRRSQSLPPPTLDLILPPEGAPTGTAPT